MREIKLTDRQRRNAILKLAYDYLIMKDCRKCGYPRVDGYCCAHCGDHNPDMTIEEEKSVKSVKRVKGCI